MPGGLCGEIPPTAWPHRLDRSNPAWAAYVAAVYGESQPLPTPDTIDFLYHAEGISNAVTQFSLPDPYCYHLTASGPAPCGSADALSTPRVDVRGGGGREWIARTHMLYNPIHVLNGKRTLNYTDGRQFPDGSWVEVLSYNAACGRRGGCKKRTERNGCSFVISRGSGVFVPIGRALRVPRKRDASDALQIENPHWAVKMGLTAARGASMPENWASIRWSRESRSRVPRSVCPTRWTSLCYAQVSALAGMDAARVHQHPCAQA